MSQVEKAKVPTMIMLGANDRRVPNSQGKELYHALRELGIETALKVYPKAEHAISKAEEEADTWIHFLLWFEKHQK